MVITSISDPASNLAIVTFLGALVANLLVTLYGYWQAIAKYGKYDIKIEFSPKVIFTAVGALVPIFAVTYASFAHTLNEVTAQDPVSYFAAFGMAFGLTAIANLGANKIILPDPVNPKQSNERRQAQIREAVLIHEFNQKLKRENQTLRPNNVAVTREVHEDE